MIRAEGPHKLVGVETRTRGPGGVRRLIELYKEGMDGWGVAVDSIGGGQTRLSKIKKCEGYGKIVEVKSEGQACFFGHVTRGARVAWRRSKGEEGQRRTQKGDGRQWWLLRPDKGTDALGRGDKSTEAMISTVPKGGLRAPSSLNYDGLIEWSLLPLYCCLPPRLFFFFLFIFFVPSGRKRS